MTDRQSTKVTSLSSYEHRLLVAALIELRRKKGLSQLELARDIGVAQTFISKIEVLERKTEVEVVRAICLACGTDLVTFFKGVERRIAAREVMPDYWGFRSDPGLGRRRTR